MRPATPRSTCSRRSGTASSHEHRTRPGATGERAPDTGHGRTSKSSQSRGSTSRNQGHVRSGAQRRRREMRRKAWTPLRRGEREAKSRDDAGLGGAGPRGGRGLSSVCRRDAEAPRVARLPRRRPVATARVARQAVAVRDCDRPPRSLITRTSTTTAAASPGFGSLKE